MRWREAVATSSTPRSVNLSLVLEVHRRWFDTTFPADSGRTRTEMVMNRKATAVAVEAILRERRSHRRGRDRRVHRRRSEHLAVTPYDVHPFLDGNTRTTWHLRNYVLIGLRSLADTGDEDAYMEAWWSATPSAHDDLDRMVLEQLDREDR